MIESLRLIFERLVKEVQVKHFRFLYEGFSLENRLVGLVGPRGVGKTTLLLQYIREHYPDRKGVFYFSADHIFFNSTALYSFVEFLYINDGIRTVFIDEIHKYSHWNQEIKNLYDGFPDLKIVFSGSSSLDLIKGAYDLSRRAKLYSLPGLSFREFLNFKYNLNIESISFEHLMHSHQSFGRKISHIPHLVNKFHDYLHQGFYPFVDEDPLSYYEKILNIVEKTVYEDIANFYNLKTGNLPNFNKILNYLATIPPGKINTNNVGKNLGISDKTAANYLVMLKETGLVEVVYAAEGGNQGLRKPEKVFFNNTNLHYAMNMNTSEDIDVGAVRELAFLQSLKNAGVNVYHPKKGDFKVSKYVFEVGGKNKTREQIQKIENAFIVKDNEIHSEKGSIPLLYFGFLY